MKSSTESEIVGLSEYLPYTLWMGYFLEAQGYKIRKSTVIQDNTSALKIEKNGRNSYTAKFKTHKREIFLCQRQI